MEAIFLKDASFPGNNLMKHCLVQVKLLFEENSILDVENKRLLRREQNFDGSGGKHTSSASAKVREKEGFFPDLCLYGLFICAHEHVCMCVHFHERLGHWSSFRILISLTFITEEQTEIKFQEFPC